MANYKRKKTKADESKELQERDPLEGLPKLTPKEARFVQFVLAGDSYKDAYIKAGYSAPVKDGTLYVRASAVAALPKIQHVIRHYQRIGFDRAGVTLDSHLAQLARLRETALELGQVAAGVQAEHYRGKASGLYVDRLQVTSSQSDEALLRALAAFLGPELGGAIAQQLGHDPALLALPSPSGDGSELGQE